MLIIRPPLESEADAFVELARLYVVEMLPHLEPDAAVAHRTFSRYLNGTGPALLVAEGPGRILVGFVTAMFYDHAFTAGHLVGQEVLFVHPDHRDDVAASALVKAYDELATRANPRESYALVACGPGAEGVAELFEQLGYAPAGVLLRRVLQPATKGS